VADGAQEIGELSIKLADAALIARERGDDVQYFMLIRLTHTDARDPLPLVSAQNARD
jgi:hypothetical protein